MNWKRASIFTLALGTLVAMSPVGFAQDDPTAADDPGKSEDGGIRLYVEAAAGSTSLQTLNTSLDVGISHRAENATKIEDMDHARFTVGWKLKYEKGAIELVVDGARETAYTLDSRGQFQGVLNGGAGDVASEPFDWWFMSISDGKMSSAQYPPTWGGDANGNGTIDRDELVYPDDPAFSTTRSAPDSLDNNWQTWDLVYRRGFGGTRWAGRWSAGVRHFIYEGNLLAPAWIWLFDGEGRGYTEGAAYPPLTFSQKASGTGPVGSMGFEGRFFRDRLEAYFETTLAFVLSNMESETGDFVTLVEGDRGEILTAPANLSKSFEKDVWQLTGTVGVRWRIFAGLSLRLEYFRSGYQDAIVVATTLNIPENRLQIPQGTVALWDTTDLRFDGYRLGVRYEF